MDVNDQDIYQGVVLLKAIRQVEDIEGEVKFKIRSATSKNSFLIEELSGKEKLLGVYIKYTKKSRSPWNFSFHAEHQEEIDILKEICDEVLITFVCHHDGVVCLTFEELKAVLDDTFEESESVRIRRKSRGNYWIKGRDGNLETSITRTDLGKKIVDCLKK